MDYHTTLTRNVPVATYCVLGVGFVLQGFRYFFAAEVMPYHLDLLGAEWETLAVKEQRLLLGLLKGFGAGLIGTGVAVLLVALFPLRRGERWACVSLPLVALAYCVAIVYVTHSALLPDAGPILVSRISLALAVLAGVLTLMRVRA